MVAILLTLFVGLFFLLGALGVKLSHKKEWVERLSLSLAFGAIIALVSFDFVPEILEEVRGLDLLWCLIFVILGFVILKVLDLFVPEHEGKEQSTQGNMAHIGIMGTLALVLHNIVEGMTVYSVASLSFTSGISLMIGVGLHNIPMGMFISSTLMNEKKSKRIVTMIFLTLSTFLGGLIMSLFINNIEERVMPLLTSLALGMVLYILFFELLSSVIKDKDRKTTILGTLLGFVIVVISTFLG